MKPLLNSTESNDASVLYIVATPIGNLEDITLRALKILRSVDFIACEDTRTAENLLRHFGINKELISLHRFNEEKRAQKIVQMLSGGRSGAYISESGTPCVSDPGARIVQKVRSAGISVVPVPGVSSPVSAFSVSGFEGNFLFGGFLEKKESSRKRQLEWFSTFPWATIVFESPARIRATLKDIAGIYGDQPVFLAREMTKVHEQIIKAPAGEILKLLPEDVKGEIVIILFPINKSRKKLCREVVNANFNEIVRFFEEMKSSGMKPSRAASILSRLTGIERNSLMRLREENKSKT